MKRHLWSKNVRAKPLAQPPHPPFHVHITDLGDYHRCSWAWDKSSQQRRGLQPAIPPPPLYIGQGAHISLGAGYEGSVGGPMVFDKAASMAAFHEWADQRVAMVENYSGVLWDYEKEQVKEARQLVQFMLAHYGLWAKYLDEDWDFIATEQSFDLPLPPPAPRWLRYAGRFDGLLQHRETGRIFVLEFKTARGISDKELSGVFRTMQPPAYLWAARQIYGPQVAGILYRIMWKRIPDSPQPLKRGGYSRRKNQTSTTAWCTKVIEQIARAKYQAWAGRQDPPVEDEEAVEDLIVDELMKAEDLLQIMRAEDEKDMQGRTVRNKFFYQRQFEAEDFSIDTTMRTVVLSGLEMAGDPIIRPVGGYNCSWCKFKVPCDLENYYRDPEAAEQVLRTNYAPRDYWED